VVKVEPLTTARALRGPFDYRRPAGADVGTLLEVPFGRREVLGVVTGLAEESEHELSEPLRVLDHAVPEDLVALALWMADEYCSTPARALSLVLPPRLHSRAAPGQARRRGAPRPPRHVAVGAPGKQVELTADQREVLEAVAAARPGERLLLHGVTGSGKTEIYLRAAAATLARGQGVIVLVPEIALTPQIVARFLERFGDTVAVLHSRLTPAQRHHEWLRLRTGQARVCVGPRSAVFAPIDALGLVVVDEEHDASYKHEGDPRYDARRVAERRARGAVLLAGSATPRPEAVHALRRLRLPRRVDGRPLPPVEVLDMRAAPGTLHPATHEALVDARKAIVLLNRRGWSNFLTCRGCGRTWLCPSCDVTLVLHRAQGTMSCHHCGHRERIPARCPDCQSVSIARHGAGTERLEEELAGPVFRLDADVADAGEVLARFQAAERGVLLGTQVVAKGHDFPDVDLGVVVDADATLRFPDFRAEERTFALVTQLAGRAGRGARGRVLVQTLTPDAPSLRFAAAHDSDAFVSAELARREALRYPPFSTLIRVVCSSAAPGAAHAAASAVRERLDGDALGPAPMFRLRGRERSQVVVKAVDRTPAVASVRAAVEAVAGTRAHRAASFSVDVDPQ